MKDSTEYAPLLKKLCNRLKREKGTPTPLETVDPTTALIWGCLSAGATESKAKAALGRIRSSFVDFNELRVCRVEELIDVLGKGFPQAKEVSRHILALLKEVYEKHDSLALEDLCEGSKRQAKSFLESLEECTPYIAARVMLFSIGAHAFPMHAQMLGMLRKEKVVDPEADEADVQGFLERQITASQIRKIYPLLRKQADSYRPRGSRSDKNSKKNETEDTETGSKRAKKKKS